MDKPKQDDPDAPLDLQITTAGQVELLRLSLLDFFRRVQGREYIEDSYIRTIKASTMKTLREVQDELVDLNDIERLNKKSRN